MLKKVKQWIAIILAIAVVALSTLAILSIWGVMDNDIAMKSLGTLGVILLASALSLIIIRIVDSEKEKTEE